MKKFGIFLFILLSFNLVFATENTLIEAKKHITEIEAGVANMLINTDKKLFVLDIRSKSEYDQGHIKGAVLIPKEVLMANITENKLYPEINNGKVPISKQAIIIYSSNGDDGLLAGDLLKNSNFNFIFNIKGGFQAWKENKLSYEISKSLFNLF